MANLLLVLPSILPEEDSSVVTATTASFLPPIGLATIAAYLRQHGHNCRIVDGVAEGTPLEEIVTRAKAFGIIGVSAMTAHAKRAIELVQMLKKETNTMVVAGGVHATTMPGDFLEVGADFVVIGEGEITMLEFVEAVDAGASTEELQKIDGLCFLKTEK